MIQSVVWAIADKFWQPWPIYRDRTDSEQEIIISNSHSEEATTKDKSLSFWTTFIRTHIILRMRDFDFISSRSVSTHSIRASTFLDLEVNSKLSFYIVALSYCRQASY